MSVRLLSRLTPLAAALLMANSALADQPLTLDQQVITANPLKSQTLASPTSVVEGDDLTLRESAQLGETLKNLPGVSSTYFGPVASRPVIRGFDGDRIRVLRNGVGALDASSLSYDHAVPYDSANAERIEVVRGPAALLYGGSAVGGVVNTFDNRIPTEPVEGVHGGGELRYGGADTNRSAAGKLEAGDGNFALHVDANSRQFNDTRIPGYAHSSEQRAIDGDTDKHRVGNSDGRQDGGAIGGAYHWDHGYVGLSYDEYDGNYGSPAEDSVRIDMEQRHSAMAAEIRDLQGPFSSVKLDVGHTTYEHREIEDGEVGTTFKNEGYEARVEARHKPIGPVEGVVGVQVASSQFQALGEEAFVPQTDTDSTALFALESWQASERLNLTLGGRLEHTKLSPDAEGNERFEGTDEKHSFTAGSLSFGSIYTLTDIWSLAGTLSYTERAPTFYELYANGPHEATGTYEVGDANAEKEKSWSTDLALRFDNGTHKGSVGVFYSRFSNYIGLLGSGRYLDEDGQEVAAGDDEALPEYLYSGVKAEFWGVEAQDLWRLAQTPYGDFALQSSADYTRAKNKDNGQPLPRISPLRLNSALLWNYQSWQASFGVEHASAQRRVPNEELSTDGYTTLNASLGYRFDVAESQWLAFVKGDNLNNQTIRYASSILRDEVPAAGRSIEAGVKVAF
ncbi:TonB-dependent receptor [Pseudomonas sp. LRF_L74]|uniref:TonB-dependent receptor n=1 Tax=Pseudomonas sp. LRF_L74 TaxID=3369422 RepID=UPI003F6003CE